MVRRRPRPSAALAAPVRPLLGDFHILTFVLQMQIFYCLRDATTILGANEILTPGVILTLLDIKCYAFVRYRRRATEVFRIMTEMEQLTRDQPDERSLITRAIRRSDNLTAIMWLSCEAVITLRYLVTLFNGKRELMFPAVLPDAWQTDDQSFAIYNGAQFVLTVLGSCGLSTLDTYGPTMYLLLNAFVLILSKRLERLGAVDGALGVRVRGAASGGQPAMTAEQRADERRRLRELIDCIRMHQQCLK